MKDALLILSEAIPWIVSLLSVLVSLFAVISGRRVAKAQAFFEQKARAYDDFLRAFSTLAYNPVDLDNRNALTHALYRSCVYAQEPLRRQLTAFADLALAARTKSDFVDVEYRLQDLLDGLYKDLKQKKLKK